MNSRENPFSLQYLYILISLSFLIRYQATNQLARFSAGGFSFHKQVEFLNKSVLKTQKNRFQ